MPLPLDMMSAFTVSMSASYNYAMLYPSDRTDVDVAVVVVVVVVIAASLLSSSYQHCPSGSLQCTQGWRECWGNRF